MRLFTCSPFGDEVDLDNPVTFSYLPDDTHQLRTILFKEFGFAILYMNYFHPDIFCEQNTQRIRIDKFMENYSQNHLEKYNDVLWLKEQVFIFQDEIENMC